jgi:hypothetical protein
MQLTFPEAEATAANPPTFQHITNFRTSGVVMNIFLLDPASRLLSAFIWMSQTNSIGLYVLLDWDQPDYVFIDTGIECVRLIPYGRLCPSLTSLLRSYHPIGPVYCTTTISSFIPKNQEKHFNISIQSPYSRHLRRSRHTEPISLPSSPA